jgi:hypothetical protein
MPRILAPFMETKGPMAAEIPAISNLILWMGMSEAWIETLNALFTAGLIWRQPCAILNYLVDGAMLQFPVAKRRPKGGYATPHWAPVCFRPIEHVSPQERKKYGPPPSKQKGAA